MKNKGTVYVGLSGGVDSSVAAALLKEQGYHVVGVFIKVWQPTEDLRIARGELCEWKEDRLDAMRVASYLDIPFITLDLSKEYKEEVVDYMMDSYKRGLTPNPDVMCNKMVKFGAFFRAARKAGADFIATGHYAQVVQSNGFHEMLRGIDDNKDQTYFLWTLKQEHLAHTLFPVGAYLKVKVRKLAEKFGLPTATKKDSQGLCFIGKLNVRDFLKNFIDEKEGSVLDESGAVVGSHEGAMFYTHGQRHGFIITKKGTNDTPYFIVGKNIEENTITVSHIPLDKTEDSKTVTAIDTNWIRGAVVKENLSCTAQVRYRQDPQECTIIALSNNKVIVRFTKEQIISPGQSLVLYDRDICLGGGVIA